MSDSFGYLCYGSTAIIDVLILSVQEQSSYVRIWRLQTSDSDESGSLGLNYRTDKTDRCNSGETAQPGDRTTDPDIVMRVRYESTRWPE